MFQDNTPNAGQFACGEAASGGEADRIEPELASGALSAHMHVHGFVTIKAVKVEPMWSGNALDRRHARRAYRGAGQASSSLYSMAVRSLAVVGAGEPEYSFAPANASRLHLVLRLLDAQVKSALVNDPKFAAWHSAKRIGRGRVVPIEVTSPAQLATATGPTPVSVTTTPTTQAKAA